MYTSEGSVTTTYQVVVDGLHGKEVPGGVYHGGSELEARGILDHHIVDQILYKKIKAHCLLPSNSSLFCMHKPVGHYSCTQAD